MEECNICAFSYNKSTRKKVTCNHYTDQKKMCNFSCCQSCVKRYVLSNKKKEAHCMSCQNKFERQFMLNNLTRTWVDNEYKKHLSELLLIQEKSRCQLVMQEAINYKKIPSIRKENNEIERQIDLLRQKKRQNDRLILAYNHLKLPKDMKKKERKMFKRKCPIQDCKGFLNQRYHCDLCSSDICKNCMEKVDSEEHKCDPDKVETIRLLNKDTKPCPCCGEMIMKIHGCDQMWCPSCKNAWSWSKGTIERGLIHNPHFYEFQRRMNEGKVTRNLHDVPCGELPMYFYFERYVIRRFPGYRVNRNEWANIGRRIAILHRFYGHFTAVIVNPIKYELKEIKTDKTTRVNYLLNHINEDRLKEIALSNKMNVDKNTDIINVYEIFQQMLKENLLLIYNYKRTTDHVIPSELKYIKEKLQLIEKSRVFVNERLSIISYRYKRSVKIISEQYRLHGHRTTNKNDLPSI